MHSWRTSFRTSERSIPSLVRKVVRNVLLGLVTPALTVSFVASCGDTERNPTGKTSSVGATAGTTSEDGGVAGAPANAGGSGGAGGAEIECAFGHSPYGWIGVPVIDDGRCVDSMQAEVIDLCLGTEELGWWRYHCYRRISDGREYWLALDLENHPDPATWELCELEDMLLGTEDDPRPPPPCFAEHCGDERLYGLVSQPRIFSTCNEEQTKSMYACGDRYSMWDEECCHRQPCTTNEDCADDEECTSLIPDFWYCWISPLRLPEWEFDRDVCSCGGSKGGIPELYCVPVD